MERLQPILREFKFKFAHFSGVNKQRIDFESKQYGPTLLHERKL